MENSKKYFFKKVAGCTLG